MTSLDDSNLLSIICSFVDDPKTYFNFALACKKTRILAQKHKDLKMDQFAIEVVKHDDGAGDGTGEGDMYIDVYHKLPNGNLHGIWSNYCSYVHYGDHYSMYYDGILLATCWCDYEGRETTITHLRCDCTSVVDKNYTNSKLGHDDATLLYVKRTSSDCKKCGKKVDAEEERWIVKEQDRCDGDDIIYTPQTVPLDMEELVF